MSDRQTYNINLDELRIRWHGLGESSGDASPAGDASRQTYRGREGSGRKEREADAALIRRICSGKATTTVDRLAARYRRMIILPVVGLLCNIPLFGIIPWYGSLLICLFFVSASLMDLYLYKGIKWIDPVGEGVESVAARARHFRRRHHLFQMFLIPAALVIVLIYLGCLGGGYSAGVIAGVVIGLAIGLPIYFKFMGDYRRLLSSDSEENS